jgi:hypothetical protein
MILDDNWSTNMVEAILCQKKKKEVVIAYASKVFSK